MPIDSELPPAPVRSGWETAHRLEIRWTIPMGGKPVVSANYQIPIDVFNRIASQRGYTTEQRNRMRSVLVGDVPQNIPESWRSLAIRQWFSERMPYYTPAQIRSTVLAMEAERLQNERRARAYAEQLDRDRADREAAIVAASATMTAGEIAAELDIPF